MYESMSVLVPLRVQCCRLERRTLFFAAYLDNDIPVGNFYKCTPLLLSLVISCVDVRRPNPERQNVVEHSNLLRARRIRIARPCSVHCCEPSSTDNRD